MKSVFALICAALIAFVFMSRISWDSGNLEEVALGLGTGQADLTYNNSFVHCFDLDDIQNCINPARERNLPFQVIWLGNSQLHAINQVKPGERSMVVLLAEMMRPKSVEVLGFSQPNANLQEHALLYTYLTEQYRPNLLIVPLVFDDTRENSIRASILRAKLNKNVMNKLSQTPLFEKVQASNVTEVIDVDTNKKGRLQRATELWLNLKLEKYWTGWRNRPDARGKISLLMYKTRNLVLGLSPTSKRRLLPSAYAQNLNALQYLLCDARTNNINVITYIAPLRDDVEPPYIVSEYQRFKSDTEAVSNECGASFINFEKLVPSKSWGTKDTTTIGGSGEIDFMHFQFEGHQLMANELSNHIDISRKR